MDDYDMDTAKSYRELENLRKIRRAIESNSILEPEYRNAKPMQVSEQAKIEEIGKIDFALTLNRQCDEKLLRLEKILEIRLVECRDKLKKVRGQNDSEFERRESFRYINCGRPYFKDKENFAAPDNIDTLIMTKNHMYDFSTITSVPGWTMRDKTQLWNQIEKMTKTMRKKELQSKIAALKRECKKKKFNEKATIERKISGIKKEITKVNKNTLHKLALPIDKEYDWEEVTHSLDRRHSAAEYRALWKLYLHPSINKSSWEKSEHQLLQKIAHDNDLHGWEHIAEIMGKNRTGYQCFVYFRTNMNNTFTGKKWGAEEVSYLLRLIEYYKEDDYIPWVKVAALMENRTKIQIYNKYSRLLEQRKGRFLQEEDAVILTSADDFGPDYKKMAQFLPGRSITQIRVRYQALMKKRVSTVWTVHEDRKLLQLLSNQDSAANYASVTKYFPGKDRINIRARYVTLVKWMKRNPNADIAKAPRRGARRLGHGKASDNLNIAIASLKTRIQTEANKKKNSRINAESTEEAIEDGIVAALINETVCNHEAPAVPETIDSSEQSILQNESVKYDAVNEGNLQRILIMLRASLNKERFESRQNNGCPSLSKTNEGTCIVKVKSYSKQNKIKSIELNAPPDIWGNRTFKTLEHVLPPQYATITGCRKLMTYVANKIYIDTSVNFSVLGRRNVILREQLDILMERFNTLFLWPLLLSNEGPNLATIFSIGPCSSQAEFEKEIELARDSDNSANDDVDEGVATATIASESDAESENCMEVNIQQDQYSVNVKHY